jgi:hypothetical protein
MNGKNNSGHLLSSYKEMVFVKQVIKERPLKTTRGFIAPVARNLPHKQKKLNEPEVPLEAIKKLTEKHQKLTENTAQKRLLEEHSRRMQVASELDRLRGNPGLIQGLVHKRVQNLSSMIGFDPQKHRSGFDAV